MFSLFTPSAETEHYVLGNFRPNMFGGRVFGASLLLSVFLHTLDIYSACASVFLLKLRRQIQLWPVCT